jgi:hypothetical protein
MAPDIDPHAFTVAVRPAAVKRGAQVTSAAALGVFAIFFAVLGIEGSLLGSFALFAIFSGIIIFTYWALTHGLEHSEFSIDMAGMTIRTPRISQHVPWSDLDETWLSDGARDHLVLADLRTGVPKPTPTPIGLPRWSIDRRCLVIARVETFDTTPEAVEGALRQHAGAKYRVS